MTLQDPERRLQLQSSLQQFADDGSSEINIVIFVPFSSKVGGVPSDFALALPASGSLMTRRWDLGFDEIEEVLRRKNRKELNKWK